MRTLLVIEAEDEDLCGEAAETILLGVFQVRRAGSIDAALRLLEGAAADAILIALPAPPPSKRSFWPWKREPKDTFALEQAHSALRALRSAEHHERVLIHDLPSLHLEPLRELYGAIDIISVFEGAELREALGHRRASRETLADMVRLGERISRTLRNVEHGVPDRVVEMFLGDVFGRPGEPSASERFAELDPGDFDLQKVRDMFAAVDSIEQAVRKRDPKALALLARRVREISHAIRVWNNLRSQSAT